MTQMLRVEQLDGANGTMAGFQEEEELLRMFSDWLDAWK